MDIRLTAVKFDRKDLPTGTPVVGMVGGGQLARMTQETAVALGIQLRVLAEGPAVSAAQAVADAPVATTRTRRPYGGSRPSVTW